MPQGLVPMLNTPSASATTLQTIGSVCWPFGNGASSRFGTCRLVLLVAAMSYQIMHSDTHFVFFAGTDLSQIPPPLPPGLLPDVKPSDFNAYKQAYASRLARFQSVRQSNFVPRIDSDDFVPGAQRIHTPAALLYTPFCWWHPGIQYVCVLFVNACMSLREGLVGCRPHALCGW